jgi:hypothetical protein
MKSEPISNKTLMLTFSCRPKGGSLISAPKRPHQQAATKPSKNFTFYFKIIYLYLNESRFSPKAKFLFQAGDNFFFSEPSHLMPA